MQSRRQPYHNTEPFTGMNSESNSMATSMVRQSLADLKQRLNQMRQEKQQVEQELKQFENRQYH